MEVLLTRCSRVSHGKEVGTTGGTCYCLGLCRYKPCRELGKSKYHSGILIYVSNTRINFYRNTHNTVESSSFGSEFVVLRISAEMIKTLRYKLRTFGVNLEGPAEVYCDNKLVVTNSIVQASVLNKRHNAIFYHRVKKSQAAGTLRVGWILGEYNLEDLLTKNTMIGNMRHMMVELLFYNEAVVMTKKDER